MRKNTILILLTLLMCTSCYSRKFHLRERANHIKQQEIQYEHSKPACKDPMRSTRNWWNRPHNDVFLIFKINR